MPDFLGKAFRLRLEAKAAPTQNRDQSDETGVLRKSNLRLEWIGTRHGPRMQQ